MLRHGFGLVLVVLCVALGCGGVKDPSAVSDKKMSELSPDDIRGICAHNIRAYESAIPVQEQNVPDCAGLTLLAIYSMQVAGGAKPSHETCLNQLNGCVTLRTSSYSPEQQCENLDVDNAQKCQAPVADLQACMQERIERAKEVIKLVKDDKVCDVAPPFKEVDLQVGPACTKVKTACEGFRLALPGLLTGR